MSESKKSNKRRSGQTLNIRREARHFNGSGPTAWNPPDPREKFAPPQTLGGPHPNREELRLALDGQLERSGAYELMRQSRLAGGESFEVQFMGYAALAALSQNALISACVNTLADDMTREWIKIKRGGQMIDQDRNGQDDRVARLEQAAKKYELRKIFHQAARLTALFGGCLIFIDTGAQGQDLQTPLLTTPESLELQSEIRGFTVIEPVNCFPGRVNSSEPLKADYYQPVSWWICGQQVHASRLIRITGVEPPLLFKPAYNFFGIPHAQVLYDYVLHFQNCRLAAQRLLSKFSSTVLKTNMEGILTQAGGAEQLDLRVGLYSRNRNNDGVFCIDKETEDFILQSTPLSGVTDIVRQSLEHVAAVNRTPAVKLLGISPSGFNATGESDLRNYYDHVKSQQESRLREGLSKALAVLQLPLFGQIDPDIDFEFRELSGEDQAVKAELRKLEADRDALYLECGVLEPQEIRARLAGNSDSGYDHLFLNETAREKNQDEDFR